MTNCEMFARSKTDQELIPKDLLIINKKKIRKICEGFGRVGKKPQSRTLIGSAGSWASPGGRARFSDWGLLQQPCS